jgi:hypothetical protein
MTMATLKYATLEELLGAIFSMWFMPRLYKGVQFVQPPVHNRQAIRESYSEKSPEAH